MEDRILIINLQCELDQGCKATASGHSSYSGMSESGSTPDEARGHLLRSLYLGGYLSNPVKIILESTMQFAGNKSV